MLHKELSELAKMAQSQGIKSLFNSDESRSGRFSWDVEGLLFDLSKTHISQDLVRVYSQLAEELDFVEKRQQMFSGASINRTEDRAVLHHLLRARGDSSGTKKEYLVTAQQSQSAFLKKIGQLRDHIAERKIRSILHVGIGGSVLGSRIVYEALKDSQNDLNVHFLSNIDGHELVEVLHQCQPESTLVVAVSKTFTTSETLQNLSFIEQWFGEDSESAFEKCCYAITAQPENAERFGILRENTLTFPEWVGGRFSLWSAVSLSVGAVIGADAISRLLQGAEAMDEYFYRQSPQDNVCFIAAAMDHFYTNFMQAQTRAVFAYDFRLRSLIEYLQQLEMESNGKDRSIDGLPVTENTAPVVWGGVGTDVQHSVFQLLHQGTHCIPCEFVLVKTPNHVLAEHHAKLLANGIAQSAALLEGQTIHQARERNPGVTSESVLQAKVFRGDRPSSTLILDRLDPYTLGKLLAFYEHRTFCGGVLTNINSFDQMGVELGKYLAKQVGSVMHASDSESDMSLDESTRQLLSYLKAIEK